MLGTAAAVGSSCLGRCGLPLLDTVAWLVCDKRQEPALKAEATTNRVNMGSCPSASQSLNDDF